MVTNLVLLTNNKITVIRGHVDQNQSKPSRVQEVRHYVQLTVCHQKFLESIQMLYEGGEEIESIAAATIQDFKKRDNLIGWILNNIVCADDFVLGKKEW